MNSKANYEWGRAKEHLTALRYKMAEECSKTLVQEFAETLVRFCFREGTLLVVRFDMGLLTLALIRGDKPKPVFSWDGEGRPMGRGKKLPITESEYPLCKALVRICKALGELDNPEDITMLFALTGKCIMLRGPRLVPKGNGWTIKEEP